jgi:hypothetical protein
MNYPMYLNATPIVAEKKIRNGVTAYKFRSGVVEIKGMRYMFYSMTQAIAKWRRDNPIE